jgi:predicted nucleic acid-binding protein
VPGASASGACLLPVESDAIELYVSQDIMAEICGVLARPRVRQKFSALTDEIVDRFVATIESERCSFRTCRVFSNSTGIQSETAIAIPPLGILRSA